MATEPAAGRTTRRPVHPGRKRLGLAAGMVMIGSFLPWIQTSIGSVSGGSGPGLWTFYAGMFGLAGALVPMHRIGAFQAAVLAAAAIVLPTWQVGRLLSLVGTDGWLPGPGVVLVFGGGVLAAVAGAQLLRPVPDH